MKAAELIADILVAGLIALLWIGILALALTNPSAGDFQSLIEWTDQHEAIVTLAGVVATAFGYVAGVFVDRLSDSLLAPIEPKPSEVGQSDREGTMRVKVLHEASDGLAEFITYQRTRVRIARASAFNFFMLTFAVAAYTEARAGDVDARAFLLWSAAALLAGVTALIHVPVLLHERAQRKGLRSVLELSRVRARLVLTLVVATIVVPAFLTAPVSIAIIAGGLTATLIAALSWYRIACAALNRLVDAYSVVRKPPQAATNPE